jgi:alpha-L-arabinofuranosidase
MKIIVFALLTSVSVIAVPDNVSIDVQRVLADVSSKPLGINTDFFVDDDGNRPAQRNLDQALAEMGVKYLRYPGGEKSDGYLWSVPPYDRSQPALARWAAGDWPQNQEWPSYDRNLIKSDGRTLVKNPLDFDEFMRLTRTVNGEPVLVVAYDSMYKPAQANGSAPTRAQLLETARQWVRYANVIKGYNVRYWEIGNESYLPGYNSDYISPPTYAQDVIEFSQVMKSVDPSIKIIANGDDSEWWRVVLTQAGPAIDLLSVHNYPPYGWGGYDYYRTRDVDLMSAVHIAEQALDAYAGPNDAQRIKIAVTEMNTIDWSGSWAPDNDMGHAIVLFDAVGNQLNDPRIGFSQVWNTRWVTNDLQRSPAVWDTLDKDNNLQATGRAMSVWGQFLLDKMVAASSTTMVKVFASYSAGGALNLFLINKDTGARVTNVSLANFVAQTAVDRWVFKGSGADDPSPVLAQAAPIAADRNRLSVTLDPVSITVLQLQKAADSSPYRSVPFSVPGTINAKDFDDGGESVSYHDTTPGNYGDVYRATDVDVQASPGAANDTVGWIDTGEWLQYTVQVARSGDYTVTATVASIYSGRSFHLELDGTRVTGSIVVPNTGGWDRWATVTVPLVVVNAGAQLLKFVADSDSFNVSSFDIRTAAEPPAGSRVLFEDFEGQSAASWTPTTGSWAACKPSASASGEYCASSASENVSLAGSLAWRDYYVQAYVYLDNDAGSGVTILGRVQDATHFYQAELRQDDSGNKTWTLCKNSGGRWSYIGSGYFNYAARDYYLLRLSLVGSSIDVSISTDWGTSFQRLGGGSDTEFAAGKVGLRSWGSPARFDSVEVWLQ